MTGGSLRDAGEASNNFFVKEADYVSRGGDSLPSYHIVNKIEDRESGGVYTLTELTRIFSQPDTIGLRRPGEDFFSLHNVREEAFAFADNLLGEASLEGSNIELFDFTGESLVKDVEVCMSKLREVTNGQQVLGAIMFSCNGRGPKSSRFLGEKMADARRFAQALPGAPCFGFYTGGEIGSPPYMGRQSVFQTGHASIHSFTVVFAVFVAPKVEISKGLDDGPEKIDAFVEAELFGVPSETSSV